MSTTFATVAIEVLRHPTSIIELAPGAAGNGPLVVTARLQDVEFATHLAGKTVTFSVGNQSTVAVTNQWWRLHGKIVLNQPIGPAVSPHRSRRTSAYAPTSTTRALTIFSDTDGDGLRDDWEMNGVDADGNGTIDLDLPAMGANPLRKDLFVETDWMGSSLGFAW